MNDRKKRAILCLAVLLLLSAVLFYRYIFQLRTSDFPAHIKRSLAGRGYSINLLLFPLCYKLGGGSYLGIVILMAVMTCASAIAIAAFLKKMLEKLDIETDLYALIPIACSFVFICKLCIPEWSPYFYYQGMISTQPWHNSTYIEMRLFGIPTLMMYFMIRKEYLNKIDIKELLLFFVFLFLANLSKPNFVLAFAPIMLLVLIYDFLRSKGKSFKKAFIFGLVVLVACVILLFQYKVMFPSEGEGGVAFSVSNAVAYLTKDKKFVLQYLLNFLFPIYVSCHFIKNIKQMDAFSKKLFFETWAMNILSFLISLFIIETGSRQADGNFEWGNPFFALMLFVVCMVLLIKMKKQDLISEKTYVTANNIYIAHIVFGLFYFALLVIGFLSWMV